MKFNRPNSRVSRTGSHPGTAPGSVAPRLAVQTIRPISSSLPAFTMIEIALALGVIAFALVAIIGVLPFGLNVQKESHQDTIISEEGPFFLNAIRNGGPLGTNLGNTSLDFLTNYVEQIVVNGVTISNFQNGRDILGLISTRYPYTTTPTQVRMRALTGSALEQNGANSLVAFRYEMYVAIEPIQNAASQANNDNNPILYDVHLQFKWPVSGTGANFTTGPGRADFRAMVSGELLPGFTNSGTVYWFMQPNSYTKFGF